jgi:hypothetical protein
MYVAFAEGKLDEPVTAVADAAPAGLKLLEEFAA